MTKIDENSLLELKKILNRKKNIIITGHVNPDGDSVGSSLALYHFFSKKHHVKVLMPNDFPEFLKWLPKSEEILIYDENKFELIENADIIFSVDYNELSRVKPVDKAIKKSNAVKIMIDHHPNPDVFPDFVFSETTVSSCAELVYEFMYLLDSNLINKDIAECIFTGILMDTGRFAFNSSNPRTYEITAELLRYGINKEKIISNLYDNFSFDRMRLMGYVLNDKMKLMPDINVSYFILTQSEQEKYNYRIGDSEGFVNMPLAVKGIEFSAFFIEKKDVIKCSFRSKGNIDVNAFARKYFNGGGHKNAAGGKSYKSVLTTEENFIKWVQEFLDNP